MSEIGSVNLGESDPFGFKAPARPVVAKRRAPKPKCEEPKVEKVEAKKPVEEEVVKAEPEGQGAVAAVEEVVPESGVPQGLLDKKRDKTNAEKISYWLLNEVADAASEAHAEAAKQAKQLCRKRGLSKAPALTSQLYFEKLIQVGLQHRDEVDALIGISEE